MALITAVMQVCARKHSLALDRMTVETHVTLASDPAAVREYPTDGAFVHGLFMHGARWAVGEEEAPHDVEGTPCAGCLTDSRLKELLPPMPILYLKVSQWEQTVRRRHRRRCRRRRHNYRFPRPSVSTSAAVSHARPLAPAPPTTLTPIPLCCVLL